MKLTTVNTAPYLHTYRVCVAIKNSTLSGEICEFSVLVANRHNGIVKYRRTVYIKPDVYHGFDYDGVSDLTSAFCELLDACYDLGMGNNIHLTVYGKDVFERLVKQIGPTMGVALSKDYTDLKDIARFMLAASDRNVASDLQGTVAQFRLKWHGNSDLRYICYNMFALSVVMENKLMGML